MAASRIGTNLSYGEDKNDACGFDFDVMLF
jgi:hypothetical protein